MRRHSRRLRRKTASRYWRKRLEDYLCDGTAVAYGEGTASRYWRKRLEDYLCDGTAVAYGEGTTT